MPVELNESQSKVFFDRYALRDRDGNLLEHTVEEMWQRVAKAIAQAEKEDERDYWAQRFYEILEDFKFVPGGRIMYAAGNPADVTYYNCLAGETMVITEGGPRPIRELNGPVRVVSSGGTTRTGYFRCYGVDRLWKIELENGHVLYATANHRWPFLSGNGIQRWTTTDHLLGKRLIISPTPRNFRGELVAEGIRHGIVFGDGTSQYDQSRVMLFGKKRALVNFFEGHHVREHYAGRYIGVYKLPLPYKALPPDDYSLDYWYGFFLGLLATDGNVDKNGIVMLAQKDSRVLEKLAFKLHAMGIATLPIHRNNRPNPFNGSPSGYSIMRIPRYAINASDLVRPDQLENYQRAGRFERRATLKVVSVEPTARVEPVYCCEEPETHSFVIEGGILTGNCFILDRPKDSWEGIDHNLSLMTRIMKAGGGVGFDLSTLRPRGAIVRSVNGKSSGAVNLGEIYSQRCGQIIQGGTRRGALLLSLAVWHPDIEEFITVKRELDKYGNSVHYSNANISVRVSDDFMRAVEEDKTWKLVFPDTADPRYETEWNGDIETWLAKGSSVVAYKEVRARDLLRKIAENNWAAAEPGIFFWDTIRRHHNSEYIFPVMGTNPCVTGDTLVATDRGLVPIAELVGQRFSIAADPRLEPSSPFISGVKAFATGVKPIVRLETREGYTLRLTSDHRVLTSRGWVEAGKLQPGDDVVIHHGAGAFGDEGSLSEGRILGWFVGDGGFSAEDDSARALLYFYDSKQQYAPIFHEAVQQLLSSTGYHKLPTVTLTRAVQANCLSIRSVRLAKWLKGLGVVPGSKLQVPRVVFTGSREMQRGFLQALFSADGTVLDANGSKEIRLSSVSKTLLQQVQLLLLNFGIFSRIYVNRRPASEQSEDGYIYKPMPDGHGGQKIYKTKQYHELCVAGSGLVKFADEIGLLPGSKHEQLTAFARSYTRGPYRQAMIAHVSQIEPDGLETVYDLIVPEVHAFTANGIVVHNCGEIPASAGSVCNLGHINLSRFVRDQDVDWDLLAKTISVAVRFLDNVIDVSKYLYGDDERIQKTERRIGLGTMGLAQMLIKLGIRYGSSGAVKFADNLYRFIAEHAYLTSLHLAAEKGAFSGFNYEQYINSKFVKRLLFNFPGFDAVLRTHGIRNSSLLTQAPTGTGSLLAHTSSGIEPVYRFVIRRSDRLGERIIYDAVYEDYIKSGGDPNNLPKHFVTAKDVTLDEHIEMQAAIQKWVDQSISKTLNAPENTTIEQIEDAIIKAWKLGLKSITFFRDGSRAQVISDANENRKTFNAAVTMIGDSSMKQLASEATQTGSTSQYSSVTISNTSPPLRPRPAEMRGYAYVVRTHFGNVTVDIHVDSNDEPFELFVNAGHAGSDVMADAVAIGMLASLFLRLRGDVPTRERLEIIADKLRYIGGQGVSAGVGKNRAASLAAAVAKAIDEFLVRGEQKADHGSSTIQVTTSGLTIDWGTITKPPYSIEYKTGVTPQKSDDADICPNCGQATLRREGGCATCDTCGYSKCS